MRVLQPIAAMGWSLSIGLHVGAALLLLGVPAEVRSNRHHSQVSFAVVTRERATQPPSEPPPRGTPARAVSASKVGTARPARAPVLQRAAAPDPVDLTGTTLTGSDGAGWSSALGNGQRIEAPVRSSGAITPQFTASIARSKAPAVTGTRSAPELVAVADLSAKPVPPPLDSQLLGNYPPAAKRQGIAGKAVVSARIDADGVVRKVDICSESGPGFGAACQQTLFGSLWSVPRDRGGRAVNTMIYYTCDFRVEG
jgi:hypothetical protein